MKVTWAPEEATSEIIHEAMARLERLGEAIAQRTRAKCPVGTISRPMYRRGKYKNKDWTSRDAGALKKTIRVVRKHGDPSNDVWIMVGNKKIYYGRIVEYYTPFFRPTLRAVGANAQEILNK